MCFELVANAEKGKGEPFAANEFFTVGNGFAGSYARKAKNVRIWSLFHKPLNC